MSEHAPTTAATLRGRFAGGEDTPSAACERALAAARAADQLDPPLAACIRLLDDDARAAAAAATARWRAGQPRSPLDGVPLVVKDCIDVAGHPTSLGTQSSGPPAAGEGHAVALLRSAGVVLLAKANLHELAAGLTGFNPHHGTARNPYDPARICGGSSSGSAAAVAAGLVPLALGTDAGGSVRSPAALTGLCGLKPTFGRISRTGVPLRCDSLDHLGLLAHDAGDLATLLAIVAPGPCAADPETAHAPPLDVDQAAAELGRPLAGLRIGVDHGVWSGPLVDPAVARVLAAALDLLTREGATLCEVRLPDLELARQVGMVILAAEGALVLSELGPDAHPRLGETLHRLATATASRLAADYLEARRVRDALRERTLALLADCDVLALPSVGCVAPLVREVAPRLDDAVARRLQSHLMPANLTGLPALSLPCGFADGLPVGLQLVGRPWAELTLLRVAAGLQRAGGSPRRRPTVWLGG